MSITNLPIELFETVINCIHTKSIYDIIQLNSLTITLSFTATLKGITRVYQHGLLHKVDGPAVFTANKDWKLFNNENDIAEWWIKGKKHRIDGPAVIKKYKKKWYQDGQKHRIGGPAIEDINYTEWYQNGKLHRLDGPAVEDASREIWYKDGLLHRDDGPAYTCFIERHYEWYQNGVLHRVGGPAKTNSIDDIEEWWENGKQIDRKIYTE
jgi:hypothetical protein